jgi:hypothetical protein
MRFALLLTLTDALRANGDCLFNGGVAGTMDLLFGECKAFSLVVLFVWIEAGGAFFLSGCMLALRLVGVGAGPSPALIPSSDNTDLLLFTVVVLPTAVDIFFVDEMKKGRKEREKKKKTRFIFQ